jgi:hypothetical protein
MEKAAVLQPPYPDILEYNGHPPSGSAAGFLAVGSTPTPSTGTEAASDNTLAINRRDNVTISGKQRLG